MYQIITKNNNAEAIIFLVVYKGLSLLLSKDLVLNTTVEEREEDVTGLGVSLTQSGENVDFLFNEHSSRMRVEATMQLMYNL